MSVLDNLFDRKTTDHVQDAGQKVSIIYATALADSSGGYVLVQLGDAITADEAMGAEDDAEQYVDMADEGDDDTTYDIDEDSDAEALAAIDVEEGIEAIEDVPWTDATDETDEDTSDEILSETEAS